MGERVTEQGRPGAEQEPAKRGRPEAEQEPAEQGRPEAEQEPAEQGRPGAEQEPAKRGRPGAEQEPAKRGRPEAEQEPAKRGRPEADQEPAERGRPGAVVVVTAVIIMIAFVGLLAYSLITRETMPMDTTTRASIAAPSFTLSQLNGAGEASLSDFEGSPIVVNFWASWCAPCRVEMPHLVEAHERYAGQGVRFIGVAIQDTTEDALAFIEEFNVPIDDGYVMVTDPDGEATIDYGVGGLPVTFFIERDGTVHTRWAGVVTGAILDERIAEITG